ncbi:hypothetical protein [Bradyrhizobium sp. AUGA SZCCT0431]|nr:hypothetical protein [Bradyrhizobium sp. AUGA SZCCT0431]
MADSLVRLEQHPVLVELCGLQMRTEKFHVGRREKAEQLIHEMRSW